MAKEYVGKSTLTKLIELVKGEITKLNSALSGKVNTTDIVNDLTSTETGKPLSAAQGKALSEMISASGNGDMLKATYDTDGDGVVDEAKHAESADTATTAASAANADNASKLDGHDAEDFLLDEDLTEISDGDVAQLWGN